MKALKWILLTALVVVVAAGATGVYAYNMGKQEGRRAGLAARTEFLAARAGGAAAAPGGTALPGAAQRGGQGTLAGNFAAGQVKSVAGNEIEVSTANGVTKVKLTDKTQIEKTVVAAPADIKPGERVIVQGARGSDGVVEAATIQLGAGRFAMPAAAGGQGQGGQ